MRCSLVVPVTEKGLIERLDRNLKEKFVEYELIEVWRAGSMAEVWQQAIAKASYDYVAVVHQDVEIYDWVGLDGVFGAGVGMVGVAGAREITYKKPVWFDRERLWEGKLSGQIFQRMRGREWLMRYGDYGEVVVLDGVCLVVRKEVLGEGLDWMTGLDWARWNWYDQVLSLKVGQRYKLKTVPIQLAHFSAGTKLAGAIKDKSRFLNWAQEFGLSQESGLRVKRGLVKPLF